ncbi:hexuronate transporter [Bacillus sp. FJAT-18017]|uniref:MFS transporter n=1 Tax=Bacillus sp. FJAT-18017 TaxID=1705566 RepID=UPI0006AFF675|nr:MFS transporter [Bacillus sp. FJAT-18017]ALC89211.1 hexuronate transporter [Bacillus sp. FJAT-18017]
MYTNFRYVVLVFLFIASLINYIDRAALSVLAPMVSEDLNLDPASLGIIFSSFAIGYAIFCFVGGYFADKFGPRKVFATAMGVWSLFAALTAFAFSFLSLFIIRIIFGAAEGPNGSVTNKTVSVWFPEKERARAVAISFAGNPLGGAIAAPIITAIALAAGWKVAFIILGLIGFVWVAAWLLIVKENPGQLKNITKEELNQLKSGVEAQPGNVATEADNKKLGFYLRQPTILFTAFAFFSYSYILFFFMTWFPSYLMTERGLDMKSMSIANTLPWIVGAIGLALGGFISDYIFKKTKKLLFSRKIVIVIGLLISAVCVGMTGLAASLSSALTLMSIGIFFMYITTSCYWAIIQDSVKGTNVGGVSGFVHFLANTAGIIAPTITGFVVQATGHYTGAFFLAGGLAILASILVSIFVKPMSEKLSTNKNIA